MLKPALESGCAKTAAPRRGFMLVEVVIAGAILSLLVCALFEGLIVASKTARENADLLAADALAYDLVWMKFNEEYAALASGTTDYSSQVAEAAPALARHWPNATAQTLVQSAGGAGGKLIVSRVTWGKGNERSLERRIFRGALTRVVKDK